MPKNLSKLLLPFQMAIVVEEHSQYGGLASSILEHLALDPQISKIPKIRSISLKDQFALSEHGLADHQLLARVKRIVASQGK